jgi:hypothetical protein
MTSFRGHDFPVDLSFLSSSAEQSAILSSYMRNAEDPGEKIDYSDWSNFNTYSSCYNRYNIFLWKLFNEYDRTWSWDEHLSWWDKLNGHEKYAFKQFPSYNGYFFNSGTIAGIKGVDYSNKMSLTSSYHALSIEFLFNLTKSFSVPNTNNNQYIFKAGSGTNYYEVYLSSSNDMVFRVQSGSTVFSASYALSSSDGDILGVGHHIAFCYATSSARTDIYLDGILASQISSSVVDNLVLPTGSTIFVACSSSNNSTADTCFISGGIDELRVWNSYRTQEQITEYYQRRIKWEPELKAYLKFNEPDYTTTDGSQYNVVYDYAKSPIDFRIENYSSANKVAMSLVGPSGNLMVDDYDYYDPIILDDHPNVITHINEIWESAKEYDAGNRYLITNLIPQSYIDEEEINGIYNLTNLLYVFARQLDEMKTHIQQVGYFHDAELVPYKLLQTAIKLYGFEAFDNFPVASINDYLVSHSSSNDVAYSIREVNDTFWRNILSNIIYIYKTKGTRESVNSFLHCVGLNEEIVSIKDCDSTYSYPVTSSYVNKTRYSKILSFTTSSCAYVDGKGFPYELTNSFTIETLASFKPYEYWESGTFYTKIVNSQPTVSTGSVWWSHHSSSHYGLSEVGVIYTRELTSSFGKLYYVTTSSLEGGFVQLETPEIEIFDGNFYNVSMRKDSSKIIPQYYLDVRKLDSLNVIVLATASANFMSVVSSSAGQKWFGSQTAFGVGAIPSVDGIIKFSGSFVNNTETDQTEIRFWDDFLTDDALDSHCRNYTSIGTENPEDDYYKLMVHWILDDGTVSNALGVIQPITNYSYYKTQLDGTGSNFMPSTTGNFYTNLFEYNYLCPDVSLKYNTNDVIYGEHDSVNIDFDRIDMFSIEYNAIDVLNEDQTRLFSNMNKMSNLIGVPILSHHTNYDLNAVNTAYFTRLSGSVSFVNYFNNISGLDKFYMRIVEKLIPARSYFNGEEKVIESHMLERNKETTKISRETTVYRDLSIAFSRPSLRALGVR